MASVKTNDLTPGEAFDSMLGGKEVKDQVGDLWQIDSEKKFLICEEVNSHDPVWYAASLCQFLINAPYTALETPEIFNNEYKEAERRLLARWRIESQRQIRELQWAVANLTQQVYEIKQLIKEAEEK